jgi:predicted metal-dependent phosphoesterase TrpH
MHQVIRTLAAAALLVSAAPPARAEFAPGTRVILDAHNCYPYNGRWADRIDRALSTGTPLAIEQDLVWYRDPATGRGRSLVAHDERDKPALGLDGTEPSMRDYFFERIRPIVEHALAEQRRDTWPIITLNLDFKTEEPEHLAAVWALLREYRAWLTTAPRVASISDVQPLDVGPVLVLTGDSDAQRKVFHDGVPVGERLLVFGAARPALRHAGGPAEARVRDGRELPDLTPGLRTNYHRWWNNPWSVVELGGQRKAGAWTPADESRLNDLVRAAHRAGLWIRFYTLNGHDPHDESGGWSAGYNFGSEQAARERWQAAIRAGVDFVAVDQYELFAATLHETSRPAQHAMLIKGEITRDDYKKLFERTFDVPGGTSGLEIELSYTGDSEKTVIDLGLRGPAGFRGWSGGGAQTIQVGPLRASYGYQPGAIEAGRWAVVLGVPNIRDGRHDIYTVTVKLLTDGRVPAPVLRKEPGWFVGDLHAHSGHSDGRTTTTAGARVAAPVHRVFDAARAAGLDFVALTDHNTASHWLDVDRLQPYYDDLLLLHGREITTYRGHANAIGETVFHDFRVNDARVSEALKAPAADGAFVSINHPAVPDDERCMGCRWSALDSDTTARINGVEVVNADRRTGPLSGWPIWADLLKRGFHVTAVGGSDEHTPGESGDRRLGTPATVVYAAELSEPAIVAALKSGRVYVRTHGPDGPVLDFSADVRGHRYEMGETIPHAGPVTLTATVGRATGQRVEWIRNGDVLSDAPVPNAGAVTLDTVGRPGDWFSLVVCQGDDPTLFANAVFVAR